MFITLLFIFLFLITLTINNFFLKKIIVIFINVYWIHFLFNILLKFYLLFFFFFFFFFFIFIFCFNIYEYKSINK